MSWQYRLAQGLQRIHAELLPGQIDDKTAQEILTPDAYQLFQKMSAGDRTHALCVLARLREELPSPDQGLEEAALLHDVGKAEASLSLLRRATIVLLEKMDKENLHRLAESRSSTRNNPYYIHLHHAEIGAQKCTAAGCPAAVVELVRYHESDPAQVQDMRLRDRLEKLQAADDRC